eukprot:gnl/TRDRNA2_/TRDRNA2_196803_c0_seq1.p1 gnl/TRDRNA2_/TRDRNA2_196803_c0~~gnl/TRDRNA2_/TRDRNA2_196803_c0_seq1.p1  ORF type:complete len:445 (+),score=95.73 gnl/TRDRNA2_/TRDRNA2_196803_c0_seq1:100-1434(+)
MSSVILATIVFNCAYGETRLPDAQSLVVHKLFDRSLQRPSLHGTGLDPTALGKVSHMSPLSLRSHHAGSSSMAFQLKGHPTQLQHRDKHVARASFPFADRSPALPLRLVLPAAGHGDLPGHRATSLLVARAELSKSEPQDCDPELQDCLAQEARLESAADAAQEAASTALAAAKAAEADAAALQASADALNKKESQSVAEAAKIAAGAAVALATVVAVSDSGLLGAGLAEAIDATVVGVTEVVAAGAAVAAVSTGVKAKEASQKAEETAPKLSASVVPEKTFAAARAKAQEAAVRAAEAVKTAEAARIAAQEAGFQLEKQREGTVKIQRKVTARDAAAKARTLAAQANTIKVAAGAAVAVAGAAAALDFGLVGSGVAEAIDSGLVAAIEALAAAATVAAVQANSMAKAAAAMSEQTAAETKEVDAKAGKAAKVAAALKENEKSE